MSDHGLATSPLAACDWLDLKPHSYDDAVELAIIWCQVLHAVIALPRYHPDNDMVSMAQISARKFYILARSSLEDAVMDSRGSKAARSIQTGSDVLMDRDRSLHTPPEWTGNCWKFNTASAATRIRYLLRSAVPRKAAWSDTNATVTITWLHGPSACDHGPMISAAFESAQHSPELALLWDAHSDFATHDALTRSPFSSLTR